MITNSLYLVHIDIDECTRNESNCDLERGFCTNTEGSFQCTCSEGFSGDGTAGNCAGKYSMLDNIYIYISISVS